MTLVNRLARVTARRLAAAAIACVAIFGGSAVTGLDEAEARIRCESAAYGFRGRELPSTRTQATRRFERRACNVSLRRCARRLDDLRFRTGRVFPRARCEVIRIVDLTPRRPIRRAPPPVYYDGYCNFDACSRRYRSFRASDCTFQPFNGPRRRCAL